jgi:hypothetical protein
MTSEKNPLHPHSVATDVVRQGPDAPSPVAWLRHSQAILTYVALSCGLMGPTAAQTPVVDTIIIQNGNVFSLDDGTPEFLADVGNALHVRTRPWVIRRALLFQAGQPYDSARVAESARLLRSWGIFRLVEIDTVRDADGRLAARVRTADGWSTKIRTSYRAAGGDATWSVGITEANVLGTATAVGAQYRHTPDRTAVELSHVNPRLLGSRLTLRVSYADLSDGREAAWRFGLPFYQLAARHALETMGEVAKQRVLIFRDGALFDSTQRRLALARVEAGLAVRASTRGYHRLVLSAQVRREDYAPDTTTSFPRTETGAMGLYGEWGHARFHVGRNYQTFGRAEDVDLSTVVRLGVSVAPGALGYSRSGAGPEALLQTGGVWSGGFFRIRARGHAIFSPGADSGAVVLTGTLVVQHLNPVTLLAHATWGRQENPAPGEFFDLGLGRGGPRVFGVHAFTGTRMQWGTLEARVPVSQDVLGLFALGLSAFVDYGGAWFDNQPARLGGNVGLGARLGSTKSTGSDTYRFDVGYRVGEGFTGKRWAVAVGREVVF